MAIAIKIENLSKQYRLGLVSTRTLSHDLNRWWQTSILGREDPYLKIGQENRLSGGSQNTSHRSEEYVWALKDINLEVEEGEVLGIIGKNGAGKSTLLKILSKVTAPTTGIVKARGRIASLLEVGTGFHQEMTGRENIYMNGAIMGMTKAEIRKKFDEIVEFAGVEKYIDTPVKRYSSGMTVRLGFAVAAHLEPEILVVDEVLAVGDAEFQKKAVGKMQEVSSKQGRTVLFVSHQMNSISALCNRCLLLKHGQIFMLGDTLKVINKYLSSGSHEDYSKWLNPDNQFCNQYFKPLKMALVNDRLEEKEIVPNDKDFGILIEGLTEETDASFVLGIALYRAEGELLFWSLDTDKRDIQVIKKGLNKIVVWLPSHCLNEGQYRVELIAALHFKEWILQPEKRSPSIVFSISGGLSESLNWQNKRPGLLAPILDFQSL